jgi:hypothetical protein
VCGRDEERAKCGPRASSLASVDQWHVHVTPTDDSVQHARFRAFTFDQARTDAYRSDLGGDDPKACCYSHCTALTVGHVEPSPAPSGYYNSSRCIPAPPGGTSVPSAKAKACPSAVRLEGSLRAFESTDEEGNCCYSVPERRRVIKGRAARVDGEMRVAPVVSGDGWTAEIAVCVDGLSPELRARLARAWLEAAQTEHASIASFSNLATALLVFGAPADLVMAAHNAALDEIEHARIAFAIASAYAGVPYRPGELADFRRMRVPATLAELARETFVDGCVNETVASVEAAYAGERALDPAIAEALQTIAVDEARHAELAWAIVAWCVRREPALLVELRAELAGLTAPASRDADLAAHGVAGDPAAWSDAMRDVVEPCLAALA